MGRIKKRGKAGAAKNYISRNQALKKLQISLSDFRRLCILKGIFPRQPRHIKRANKGSSAPASFYYAKDIAYLQHEPVLRGLREHKAFAKKLSRAVGRGEWALAKSLNDHRPVYRIDHIIKERYPTFTDSLKDLDDALSLLTLFANLPANDKISADVVHNCTTLCAQWQSYVMRTHALRKVFLSIKGVYFQASVHGQTITWLVPYLFTQHVPADVDFRIMMTFLELYQTLLGFVLFKLYSDEGLVYPPKLDEEKDQAAAGLSALILTEASKRALSGENNAEHSGEGVDVVPPVQSHDEASTSNGKRITARDVKKQIRALTRGADERIGAEERIFEERVKEGAVEDQPTDASLGAVTGKEDGEEFVPQPSSKDKDGEGATEDAPSKPSNETDTATLFTPYRFFLSREVPRPLLEFILRAFGARAGAIGWDPVSGGAGAAFSDLADERVTHVIVDRPLEGGALAKLFGSGSSGSSSKRKFVQPQWVVDCVNRGRILDEGAYAPGKTLPAHLSPFVDEREVGRRGGYVPEEARRELARMEGGDGQEEEGGEDDESEEDEDEEEDDEQDAMDQEAEEAKDGDEVAPSRPALDALLANPTDDALLDAAELEAEANGGEEAVSQLRTKHAAALKAAKKQARKEGSSQPSSKGPTSKSKKGKSNTEEDDEAEARHMGRALLSNRQRKLYDKMSYTAGVKAADVARLEVRKREVVREERRVGREREREAVRRAGEVLLGESKAEKKEASSSAKEKERAAAGGGGGKAKRKAVADEGAVPAPSKGGAKKSKASAK